MGLAGPKKNTKISADPRNTHWASNTDRFGHRILEQYGWRPGFTLGDTTSAHHAHLTSASHTGIKVMIKDDVLGIGAKKKSEDHECTGLDVFQDLLGRLNGKDEGEVERGREAREKNKREIIVGERYKMRFVLGEVYQSSDIEQLLRKQRGEGKEVKVKVEVEEGGVAVKLEALKVEEVEAGGEGMKKKSRKRKIKEEDVDEEEEKRRRKKEKKDKKEKKEKNGKEYRREKRKTREVKGSGTTTSSDESKESTSKKPKKDSEAKESSKDRKEKKKKKKENKEKGDKKDKKKQRESKISSSSSSSEEEERDTPEVADVAASARALTGRRAIRHKYIAAKRSAVMDVQALNEIFMIKA